MRKKFLGVSFVAFALLGTMLFSPKASIAFEDGECESVTSEHGNTVHYSNKKNNYWTDGCSKDCDSVCVITFVPDPE